MILTRFVRNQLWVFSIAALVGLVVLSVQFLRVPDALGIGRVTIKAQFTEAARLYQRAEVTYRGASIGSVTALRLIPNGVEADLEVLDSVRIPAGTGAQAHSISAAGEQYVDLVPTSDAGPYLKDGDVIPVSRTTVPTQIGPILDKADALLASLPTAKLTTLINESHDALNGLGPDLRLLIDSSRALADTANETFGPTDKLLDDAEPLLATQVTTSPEIRRFTDSLAGVTDQLRDSDGDIRGLIHEGVPFAHEVGQLFDDLRPVLPPLLDDSLPVAGVMRTYHANLADVLTVYPLLASGGQTLLNTPDVAANHFINIGLMAQLNDPPPCMEGYLPPAKYRDVNDVSTAPPPHTFCRAPGNSPVAVRGVRNTPCSNAPGVRAANPADCRRGGSRVTGSNPPFPPNSPGGKLTNPAGALPPPVTHPKDR